MTTTQAPAPRIRNAATRPPTPRKLFVNVPVADVQRSIDFFEQLGFSFNTQFTDATATCMLVGEDAYVMLLTREKFGGFSGRRVNEPWDETGVIFAVSVETRDAVDAMVQRAIAAGGAAAMAPQDHGFMYLSSFYDPDGHHWEVFWMEHH